MAGCSVVWVEFAILRFAYAAKSYTMEMQGCDTGDSTPPNLDAMHEFASSPSGSLRVNSVGAPMIRRHPSTSAAAVEMQASSHRLVVAMKYQQPRPRATP